MFGSQETHHEVNQGVVLHESQKIATVLVDLFIPAPGVPPSWSCGDEESVEWTKQSEGRRITVKSV